ncbi:hypothetical protein F9C07_13261 [Aspergillus flavus]|uniref:Uncharacterized protein n=1 Tax=Aspergillus flavus (strain ATCC 200026 / FGSC A1120 / IAM 13836 / NRRL 3357 / JCM 12722 / SRRC 167) TaxID=332952 RepID=A0A7U2MZX0_ASPFN|nr:hypothetical protein F9C07_13261 [Aspergillus flavus]
MCGLGTVTITEDNNRLDIAITTIDSLVLCKATQALKCFVTLVYGYFKSDYDGFITLIASTQYILSSDSSRAYHRAA